MIKRKSGAAHKQQMGSVIVLAVILMFICATESIYATDGGKEQEDEPMNGTETGTELPWIPINLAQAIAEAPYDISDAAEGGKSETEQAEDEDEGRLEISEADENILMRLAMAEAEGESTEGKALVMRVVLNRMDSSEFPDTVSGVVFQTGQFTSTGQGGRYYTAEPDDDCRIALEIIESGWDKSEGALYFESVWNSGTWHKTCLTYLFRCGNHLFYRD